MSDPQHLRGGLEAPATGPASLWWVPLGALLAALLLASTPLHERLTQAWNDVQLRWLATATPDEELLIVDIDDASLRELQPRLGNWPLQRDVYALAIDYLRDAGAQLVALDVVFADPRDGDEALRRSLLKPGPVVLAASGQRQAAAGEPAAAPALDRVALAAAAMPTVDWAAFTPPAPALLSALSRPGSVGIITTPLDSDGRLRRLPLLHRAEGRILPSFPLAVAMSRREGARTWPTDREGMVTLAFPASPQAIASLPFSTLADAALGRGDNDALRARIRDRVVFIGSSAFLGDGVMTPSGQFSGTAVLASAYAALRDGRVLHPPGPTGHALLLALALLPAVLSWRRGRPALLHDGLAAFGSLLAVLLASWVALAVWQRQTDIALPVVAIVTGFLLAVAAQQLWMNRANRQLAYERAVADAANQAKTEFLANVSHEIRTPMTALLGVAELLAETELTPQQRRHVEIFRQSGQTLFELINDLLDLSKIEAGRFELDVTSFSLHRLLADQMALLRGRAAAKDLGLDLQLDPSVPDGVRGDRMRLEQALLNLVGNAIKFTQRGRVDLLVQREPGGGDRLRFTVRDTGIGIARSKLDAIFLPFTQADGSITRSYGGTGLGLAITKRIVELMGGRIWVDSQPGQGTSFHFTLPLPPADLAAPPVADDPVEAAPADALRLLLAEDNPVNVYLVEQMLADSGHRIDVAPNGLVALERLRQKRYHLVLMDMQMPAMDGYTTTRELRRLEADEGRAPVPVLALTANAFESDVRRSLEAGCNAHLSKPFGKAALLDAIARLHAPRRDGESVTQPAPLPAEHLPRPTRALEVLAREAGVDTATALGRLEGNEELYLRLVEHAAVFMGNWSRSYDEASAAGAGDQMLRLAHDLKGIAATLGADALSQAARQLELVLRDAPSARHDGPRGGVEAHLAPLLLALSRALA